MGSMAKTRKSFLIDSLLEKRQRQLIGSSVSSNGNNETEMPSLMDSLPNKDDEERELNTPTRSPETTSVSPLQNISADTAISNQPPTSTSTPFFALLSKFLNSEQGQISMVPQQNSLALAQSLECYNRLRLLSASSSTSAQNFVDASQRATMSYPKNPFSLFTSNALQTDPISTISSSSSVTSITTTLNPALRGLLLSQKTMGENVLPAALAVLSNGKLSTKNGNMVPEGSDKLKIKTRMGRIEASGSTNIAGVSRRLSAGAIRSSNVKKYRCDVCDKTFSRSNTLITHKRIHTGEKPFRCEHCNRAFRQPGNLTRHRLTHTTVKPFVCTECDKAFNRASNLHTHMRTHYHSWAPILCLQCGKSFGHKSDLKTHLCEALMVPISKSN